MSTAIDTPQATAAVESLDALWRVVCDDIERSRKLLAAVEDLKAQRRSEVPWLDALSGQGSDSVVRQMRVLEQRRRDAITEVTRTMVVAMRAEGMSLPQIANQFGVSHQRISNVLADVARDRIRAEGGH